MGRELITHRCIVKNLHVRWRHSQLHDRKLVFCLRVLHQRQPGTGPGKWMAACLSELIPLIFHNVGAVEAADATRGGMRREKTERVIATEGLLD